ncbi:class I SAM-dependent methyltransferase [Actinoplanes sp. NPDC051861]|uniref:class I SAM-dependent methyltransferase n=1 Tax=Actinoplanes sp. NPDC051861 TaxID=3155170 RepID=UPI003440B3D6
MPDHWAEYNARQATRDIRPLCRRAMDLAGSGAGRTAIDLGCGGGRETRALLEAGWRVTAVDNEPGTQARLLRTVGGIHAALTVRVEAFAKVKDLPPADLVYAGYSLPFTGPPSFSALWTLLRSTLRPGGRLAVNLFGVHDSWAGRPEMTFLDAAGARSLVDGLDIEYWDEEDAPGMAYSGPKHWHVFSIIACLR